MAGDESVCAPYPIHIFDAKRVQQLTDRKTRTYELGTVFIIKYQEENPVLLLPLQEIKECLEITIQGMPIKYDCLLILIGSHQPMHNHGKT